MQDLADKNEKACSHPDDLFSGKRSDSLHVIDSGTGIDPEDLPFIFNHFYKADKPRGDNPGKIELGPTICKALVNAQVAEISTESAGKGCGSTMTISFKSVGTAIQHNK